MLRSQTSHIFDHLGAVAARLRRFVGEVKAGLDALHRVQFDAPWTQDHRPTYEEWQAIIAPRPAPPRARCEAPAPRLARPATR